MCKEVEYQPFSERTLWRILRVLKPSRRRSLAGLDDITAAGMTGFGKLEAFLVDKKKDRKYIDELERGKRHLKITYQSQCSIDSEICSHNSAFALSTPKEEPCVVTTEEVCIECFGLMSILQKIIGIAVKDGSEDELYDVNKYVENILTYMKHQIRDFQQRQAKAHAFANLNDNTGSWLKDYGQKLLPVWYREGMCKYYGKKGMSNHIDVLFTMSNGKLEKRVYLTFVFRSQQSMVDVMNIGEHALTQFSIDCPDLKHLYAKPDNAGCYHGNYMLEGLYKLCLSKGFKLLRYDYNEPCKGKDQCDRESAGVKSVINSFIQSGNVVISADDLFTAVHYGKGIRNTKASVLEIDTDQSYLQGSSITNVSAYHSAQFFDTYMTLYRYYKIGPGVKVPYTPESNFSPSYSVKKNFSVTQAENYQDVPSSTTPVLSSKKRMDHTVCKLIFCQEPLCSKTFSSNIDYEAHLMTEEHDIPENTTSMDSARASFVKKMKATSQLHSVVRTCTVETSPELSLTEAINAVPLMKHISEQGWALPKRSNFRYSFKQKSLLYNIFMDGQKTGKKKSPEEAEICIRKELRPHEYVSSQQIRSLFSTFAKQLKDGTLKEPQPPKTNTEEVAIPMDDDNDDDGDGEENETSSGVADEETEYDLHMEIVGEVNDIFNELSDWKVGDYVAVCDDGDWLPGKITMLNDDKSAVVTRMNRIDNESGNRFRWPIDREDKGAHPRESLILKIDEPQPVGSKRRLLYKLTDDDYADASDILSLILKN